MDCTSILSLGLETIVKNIKELKKSRESFSKIQKIIKDYLRGKVENNFIDNLSSEILDFFYNINTQNIESISFFENGLYPIFHKYIDNDDYAHTLSSEMARYILKFINDDHYFHLLQNEKIQELEKELKAQKNLLNSYQTVHNKTIPEINSTLISLSLHKGFDLSFYDYQDVRLKNKIKNFSQNKNGVLIIIYRCIDEAFFCTLATLQKIGCTEKVRIIDSKEDYKKTTFDSDFLYVMNFDIQEISFNAQAKFIAFSDTDRCLEGKNSFDSFQMSSCPRSLLSKKLSDLQTAGNTLNYQEVLKNTQLEFYALYPYLFKKVRSKAWEKSTKKEEMIIFMLLGGWSESDISFINGIFQKNNLSSIDDMEATIKSSYPEYLQEPFIIKNYGFSYSESLTMVVNPLYSWNFFKDIIRQEHIKLFFLFVHKVFSKNSNCSLFFKENILQSFIHLDLLKRFSDIVTIEIKKLFSNFNDNKQVFNKCYELLAELSPDNFLSLISELEPADFDLNVFDGLDLLLSTNYAPRATEMLIDSYLSGNSFSLSHLDKVLLPWYSDACISLAQIKKIINKKERDKIWDLIYHYLPTMSGKAIGVIHKYVIRISDDIIPQRNVKDVCRYYIDYCLNPEPNYSQLILLLNNYDFCIFEPSACDILFKYVSHYLTSKSDDEEKFQIEIELRKILFKRYSHRFEKEYKYLHGKIHECLSYIEYKTVGYCTAWRFYFFVYNYPEVRESLRDGYSRYFEEMERIVFEKIQSIDELLQLADILNSIIKDNNILINAYETIGRIIYDYEACFSYIMVDKLKSRNQILKGYIDRAFMQQEDIDIDNLLIKLAQIDSYKIISYILSLNIDGNSLRKIDKFSYNIQQEFWNNYRLRDNDLSCYTIFQALQMYIKFYDEKHSNMVDSFMLILNEYHQKISNAELLEILKKAIKKFPHIILRNWNYIIKDLFLEKEKEWIGKKDLYPDLVSIELTFFEPNEIVKDGIFFNEWFNDSPDIYLSIVYHVFKHEKNCNARNYFPSFFAIDDIFSLYFNLNCFFGIRNGEVDKELVFQWIDRLKKGLRKQKQEDLFNYLLGHLFAFAPKEEGYEKLMCITACEIFEDILRNDDKQDASQSFYTSEFNSRGAHFVNYLETEKLAEQYLIAANKIEMNFPNVSSCYRSLHKRYVLEAEQDHMRECNSVE